MSEGLVVEMKPVLFFPISFWWQRRLNDDVKWKFFVQKVIWKQLVFFFHKPRTGIRGSEEKNIS
jgi:hypothetical protein